MNNQIEMLKNLIINKQINNPIFKEVINKAQNGDRKGVEEFARNLFKEQGRDFDKEFNEFMKNFK
jgi:hypothetical protein